MQDVTIIPVVFQSPAYAPSLHSRAGADLGERELLFPLLPPDPSGGLEHTPFWSEFCFLLLSNSFSPTSNKTLGTANISSTLSS